jgi:hypothetical protein
LMRSLINNACTFAWVTTVCVCDGSWAMAEG